MGASSWLAHVDMPSLLVTCLKPCAAGEGASRAVAGTLIETAGFGGAAELRFARDPNRAALVDGTGKELQPLTMTGDAMTVFEKAICEMTSNEPRRAGDENVFRRGHSEVESFRSIPGPSC